MTLRTIFSGKNTHGFLPVVGEWFASSVGVPIAPQSQVWPLIQAFLSSPQGSGRLEVRSWNGEPVTETDGEELLHAMVFRRDYPAMVFDAVQARPASRGRKSP